MAIDLGTAPATINKSDKTWRVELFIDDVTDVGQLRFHREIKAKNTETGQATHDKNAIPTVVREQPQVATKSYTAAGVTATGQQILALINKMSDTERQVDIDAGIGV
jgi:hypothetical protein